MARSPWSNCAASTAQAHEKKFSGVADDQRAFAFQRFSAIMKHEMNNCSSMVSQAAQTLRDIGGPRDGLTPH